MTSAGAPPGKAALDPHMKTCWFPFFSRGVVTASGEAPVSSCAAQDTTLEFPRFARTPKGTTASALGDGCRELLACCRLTVPVHIHCLWLSGSCLSLKVIIIRWAERVLVCGSSLHDFAEGPLSRKRISDGESSGF